MERNNGVIRYLSSRLDKVGKYSINDWNSQSVTLYLRENLFVCQDGWFNFLSVDEA
jgi:hypothetical protein